MHTQLTSLEREKAAADAATAPNFRVSKPVSLMCSDNDIEHHQHGTTSAPAAAVPGDRRMSPW